MGQSKTMSGRNTTQSSFVWPFQPCHQVYRYPAIDKIVDIVTRTILCLIGICQFSFAVLTCSCIRSTYLDTALQRPQATAVLYMV